MTQIIEQLGNVSTSPTELRWRRPLRILFLNYEFPPSGGGAGNATYNTALELSRRGHRVDVLTARLRNQADVDNEEELRIHRVFSHRLGIHESGLFGAATYLVSAFGRLRRLVKEYDYDIFHFYFGLPTGLLALYVHFVLKKPYVLSIRGSDVPGYDNTRWYLRPLHFLLRPLSRFIWSHAASVVALSKHLRDLAQMTAPELEIGVIGNAVASELFPRKPSTIHPGPIHLVCVCRLVKRKGLRFLIEAMTELENDGITLEIVGTGDQEPDTRRLINDSGLSERITMTGYLPRECIADRHHAADVFVLPSLSESFGQVLLEAMSCGLPVIASRVGGIPETIEHGVNGLLVEPGSSKSLVAAIRRMAAEPALRNEIGANNARTARTLYSWKSVADRYENIYAETINSKNASDRRRA